MNSPAELPRLLYIGDVPVEASYHGSALLYRLLESYPAERLRIIEAGLVESKPERRLKGVSYTFAPLPLARLQNTRLSRWYVAASLLTAAARSGGLRRAARGFVPDAILTVAHGYSWLAAARIAKILGLPLHLICHDEWIGTTPTPRFLQTWKEAAFARVYREATSRLCVSPFMTEKFSHQYGVPSRLIFPSRAPNAVEFDTPPPRLNHLNAGPVCVFAGSINSLETIVDLALLADCLDRLGGRLLVYGPLDIGQSEAAGLQRPNVELRGLLPSADLIRDMRARADVLVVPIPFGEQHRSNMEIHFPSKMTDYTAVGLPVLIWGPDYCSAVKWARGHADAAAIVTDRGREGLVAALERLKSDAEWRMRLATQALDVGRRYFSHAAAFAAFSDAVRRAVPAAA